ncbi:protein transport protein S31 [Yamadazyma tenuis]|uniref:protein transport protein S31 n=1 Tax=Candida tenuis TaxID=2315449 RepID=UPI0027A90EC5|nr:protein transport protein S31 [Yamadazyma tenuis]
MVKIEEIDRTSTFAWSYDSLPLLATGTVAGAVDLNFNSSSSLEIWDIFSATNKKDPIFQASVDNRFHVLAWSKPFEGRPKGLLAGAFENGVIEFWDVDTLIKSQDLQKASVHKSDHHSGDVKTLSFNPKEAHQLISGGSKGQIFVWDCKSFDIPKSPGTAMSPMDEVSCVAWNNSKTNVFASTGNGGYTSIWDLSRTREVLHLAYNGDLGRANFSYVAWHPTETTKLITASDNDGCPVILTWDLRNANAPEKIMQGHKKGVLSLDWCKQDPELLISSGKDNTTIVWNPITGQKLGEYPTTANWAFLTKFAPNAPDIFATASYDGKIIVQTLQDTSPPIVSKATENEDEFWNELATTDTQHPVFEVKQAPAWLKRPSSVFFGFGSKLVTVKSDTHGKSVVNINKFVPSSALKFSPEQLNSALTSNDFDSIISNKLEGEFLDDRDKADWELLKKLSSTDKKSLFTDVIKEVSEEEAPKTNGDSKPEAEGGDQEEDSFFDKLGKESNGTKDTGYTPSGSFKLFGESSSESDKKLIKLILSNKIEPAVEECLDSDNLIEALVLALDGSDEVKGKVKNAFFNKNKDSELSRVIYGASSKNITDIVAYADVSDWKHIANSISAYCVDTEDFNAKITELGDRVLKQDSSNRDDAILCYLSGGALDKIASIWLQELPAYETKLLEGKDRTDITTPFDAHFESLNNFAEKIAAYRAISKVTGALSGPSIEPICKTILEYSNLLANYGEFEVADKFSKLLPDEFDGFKAYKDRISKATNKVNGSTANTKVGGRYSKPIQSKPILSPANKYAQAQSPGSQFTPIQALPQTPVSQVPPIAAPLNPYMKPAVGAPSNPYMKPAVSNPYAAPINPYMRPQSSVGAPGEPHSIAPPPLAAKPKYKEVTDGWNDLPETFKQKPEARRAAAAAVSPAPTAFPQPALGPQRSSVSSPGAPPGAPHSGPPRAPSRNPSKASLPTVSSPRSTPVQTKRYAPPPGTVASPSQTPVVAGPSGSFPGSTPRNPYAPPASAYAPPTSSVPPSGPVSNTVSPRASHSQPVRNPYMPSTPAEPAVPQAPPSRVPSGGMIAPRPIIQSPYQGLSSRPSMSSIPPPPSGPVSGPPPTGPPSLSQPPAVPIPVEAPVIEKFPAGDRSHIPAESLPIYQVFSSAYEALKPNIPEKYAKHGEDMEKRLNILYDHLNNSELLSAGGIELLREISSKLEAKEYQAASTLVLSFASSFPEEVGHWHAGVKRLINMAEALQ